VKLATQFFSANAAAIDWCGSRGFMDNYPEWAAIAKFIKLFNAGLNRNVFNSICKYGHHPRQNGIDILQQNKILTEVTSTVKKTKIGNGQSVLPFQKEILICNSSLQHFYSDLRERFNINNSETSYITTS